MTIRKKKRKPKPEPALIRFPKGATAAVRRQVRALKIKSVNIYVVGLVLKDIKKKQG